MGYWLLVIEAVEWLWVIGYWLLKLSGYWLLEILFIVE